MTAALCIAGILFWAGLMFLTFALCAAAARADDRDGTR